MKKKVIVFLFVIALIFIGFIREFLFVNLNTIIINLKFKENYSYHHFFTFLTNYNYFSLYVSKWLLTAIFIILFLTIQIQFSYYLFKENYLKKWFLYFYLTLIILASIGYLSGWVYNNIKHGYAISRLFLGILQSPLPIIFLTPISHFYKKNIS
jgi:hypothetical protein